MSVEHRQDIHVPRSDALGDAEARYGPLVERVPAVSYAASLSPPYRALHVSVQIELVLGYSQREWLEDPERWLGAIHPEDRERVLARLAEAERAGLPWHEEYRLLARDGRAVWVRDEATIAVDGDGRPVCWQGVMLDITPRKRAEEELVRFEARYRTLVEHLPVVVYVDTVEPLPTTLYMSPQIERLTGFSPHDFTEDPEFWVGRLHPDDRQGILEACRCFVQTGAPRICEYRLVAHDDRVVWIRDETTPVHDEAGELLFCQGVMLDITEQKEAEEALRRSEAKYRALVEEIPAVVYTVAPDDESTTLYVSPQVERILGYSQEEWLDQPDIWIELLHPDDREPTLASHDLANETGEPWIAEYRLIAHDGREVWFHDEASLVRDEDGRPLFWHGVRLDVSDRKLAEEALRLAHEELERRVMERTAELAETNEFLMLEVAERRRAESQLRRAETLYRTLVEQIPGAVVYVWKVHPTGHLGPGAYVSPQIEALLGISPEEWQAHPNPWIDRLHPLDRARVIREAVRSDETGLPFEVEYRYIAMDGRVVWVHDQAVLIERDEHGRPELFHGVMYDITERKRNEERLRKAEERYRTLVEQIPGAVVYVWEAHAGPRLHPDVYVSPQIEDLFGFRPEEWYADPDLWTKRCHPEDLQRVAAEVRRCEETGEPFEMEYRYLHRDGHVVWVHDHAVLIERDEEGRPRFFQGVLFDVTERRAREDQLRRAEERYRTLVEQLPAITYSTTIEDPDRDVIHYVSPQAEDFLGYTAEELASEAVWEAAVHPEVRERRSAERIRCRDSGEPLSIEYRMFAKDGRLVWVHSQAVQVRGEDGAPRFWHGMILDVTDRKLAEERRLRAEMRYRTLVEEIPAMIYEEEARPTSPTGARRTTYVSPFTETLLGFTQEELTSDDHSWVRHMHPEDRERALAADRRADETGEPFDLEYRLIRKDGRTIWVRERAVLVRDERGEPAFWHGVSFDITQQKRAEEELRRLNRELVELNDLLRRRAHRQQEELVEARELLDELVRLGPGLIFRASLPDRSLTYVSPNVEQLLGYEPSSLLGVPRWWLDHMHPDDLRDHQARVTASRKTGAEHHEDVYRIRHRDGSYRWFHAVVRYQRDPHGAPIGLLGAAIHIPDRVRR